jgi:hypothetical protein
VGPTPVTVNVIASRLAPGETTYTYLNVEEAAEPLPSGLAAEIYAALSVLQYEGTIKNTQIEVPSDIGLGKNLNLTGGATAWASMNAQIQGITEDVEAGETEIIIGPAKHLGGDDLLEQLRAARHWIPGAFRNERFSAQPEGPAQTDGAKDLKGEGYGVATDLSAYAIKIGSKYLTVSPKTNSTIGTLPTDLTIEPRIEQRAIISGGVATIKNIVAHISDTFNP